MLHYSETAKTKTPEIKISRPIVGLLITADQAFSAFSNETIMVEIERSTGSNTNIINYVPLSAILPLSSHGIPNVIEKDGSTRAFLPLANGAIKLAENETIKVYMEGLKAGVTYTVASIESPYDVPAPYKYEVKTMNSDETAKEFMIQGFNTLHLSGFSSVTQIFLTYNNGVKAKYDPSELLMLAETDDPVFLIKDGLSIQSPTSAVIFSVEDVSVVELIKSGSTPVYLTLKA